VRVIGFCGPSGSGKTTLIERLVPLLKVDGSRVSVIKHAHKGFELDRPGKDSWRHREAGAFEVLIASSQRLAKLREYDVAGDPTVHQLLVELHACDWVLIEGFRHADVCKVELFAPSLDGTASYLDDPYVIALVTDAPQALPAPTQRPVFARAAADGLAQFLHEQRARLEYDRESQG
jgi:molybdopterin-guanine dinucleotide biosynthesis protein B